MINYASLLKKSELKSTFQRISILENIDTKGHSSIDDIYDEVVKIYPSLSLATVYKNIILMVEKSVLVEVPILGKKSKYELIKDEHIHLICTKCEEVEDIPANSNANSIFNAMIKEQNFQLEKQQINLYGVCSVCQS
jgi:Fe2+ or Zn2+ uptake regulation protein